MFANRNVLVSITGVKGIPANLTPSTRRVENELCKMASLTLFKDLSDVDDLLSTGRHYHAYSKCPVKLQTNTVFEELDTLVH